MSNKITTQINTEKRNFLKSMFVSTLFLAFGGVGFVLKSIFAEPEIKSGFGSGAYGK